VRNLLTFSRSSPINLQWVDLNQVIDRCVRLVQHQTELNNVQLQPQMAEELPQVQCDAAQIEQLLLALIMNAVDALPHGGNLWVRSRMVPEIGAVQLEVQDDGVGIPESILPNLFEPFSPPRKRDTEWDWAWPSAKGSWNATAGASTWTRSPGREPGSPSPCRWMGTRRWAQRPPPRPEKRGKR